MFNTCFIISDGVVHFPEIEACLERYVLSPPRNVKHVLVFGKRSQKAIKTIETYLNNGNGVIFISSEPLPQTLTEKLYNLWQKHTRLKFISGHGKCKRKLLEKIFKEHDISFMHVAFDSEDFMPYESHEQLGGTLSCYIQILEVISKYKRTPITFDVTLQRIQPQVPLPVLESNFRDSKPEVVNIGGSSNDVTYGLDKNHKTCKVKFDYSVFHDVFLKSMEIYTTTFTRLYNLSTKIIVT